MDWMSGLTGNLFVERKALYNTKADKILYGRIFLTVFETERLRAMYEAQSNGMYMYRHVIGGDQANNRGMLLKFDDLKGTSQPWYAVRNKLNNKN